MRIKSKIRFIFVAVFALVFVMGCGKDTQPTTVAETTAPEEFDFQKLSTFTLSSDDLHNGVWDTVITKTKKGSNRSPQLSWKPVDGAGCYAVFMIDTSAMNWVHWKSVTEATTLEAGWAPKEEYVGPYPPSGTHNYEIYVLALKEEPKKINVLFDTSNPEILNAAKEIYGDNGNILSYGHLTGTYTYGD